MARPTNYSNQLLAQFKRSVERLTSLTVALTSLSDGSPAAQINDGANLQALAAIQPIDYQGFNIVGDISSSAGQGTPEHEFQLVVQTDATNMTTAREAQLLALAARTGTATTKLYEVSGTPPVEGGIDESNLQATLPASAEVGSVGG